MATRLQMSRDFNKFMHKVHILNSKLEESIPHKFSRLYDAEHKGATGYGSFQNQFSQVKAELGERFVYLQLNSSYKSLYGKLRYQLQESKNTEDLHKVIKNGLWLLQQ